MPTFTELATMHHLAEKSVASLIAVPDSISEAERGAFLLLQQEYRRLTQEGLADGWLKRGGIFRGSWSNAVLYARLGRHPTRTIPKVETDEAHAVRVVNLEKDISRRMRGVLDEVRNAQKVILDRAGITVDLDIEKILEEARPQVEESIRSHLTRIRRSSERSDDYTSEEAAPIQAKIDTWTELRNSGLAEGWLVRRGGVVSHHELEVHPNRTVQVLESDDVVAKRVAGLTAFIKHRVTE